MKIILFIILTCVSQLSYSNSIDTLSVNQNDTLTFTRTYSCFQRPCNRHAEFSTTYKLINPVENAYYLIYNANNQLAIEGKVSTKYDSDGIKYSDFYTSIHYYYKENGKLSSIYYQKNGLSDKLEVYKRGKLKKVTFFHS